MLQKIFLLILLSFSSVSFALDKGPLAIEKVSILSEPGKNPRKYFSVIIQVRVLGPSISHWALGFYMPRSFYRLVNPEVNLSINPNLVMEICETQAPNKCSGIQDEMGKYMYSSAGLTNILSPVEKEMTLEEGKTYTLKLQHNGEGLPDNYSSVPQSFFLIENGKNVIPLADLAPEHYQLDRYDQDQVDRDLAQHKKDNWQNAQRMISGNLADQYHLLPTPVSIRRLNQPGFQFAKKDHIAIANEFQEDKANFRLISAYLKQDLNISAYAQNANAEITIKKSAMPNPEGYRLQISHHTILIEAATSTGAFYAIQTLRQLWNQNTDLPALIIKDYPRFKYRGVMLDVSRHFFSVKEVKKLIDAMAAQKLNVLHLHLSDDEGWRLDLSQDALDPLINLISIGSLRGFVPASSLQPSFLLQGNLDISNRDNFSAAGKVMQPQYAQASQAYAGYYSSKDIKDLLAYANARQITVIPEIDIPGHARALIYALPATFQKSNANGDYFSGGYLDNVIPVCLYNNETAEGKDFRATVDTIIKRIDELFSHQSTLYHAREVSVGGDEVAAAAWHHDAACSGSWLNLPTFDKEHYFFSLMQKNMPQIQFSGWQQLVQNDDGTLGKFALAPARVSHVWVWEVTGNGNGQKGIKDAATLVNAGYPTVLAFADDTYFDNTYTADKWEPGLNWSGNYVDTHAALQSAFDARQTEKLINEDQKQNLLGLEGALWSENLVNFTHMAYMALPKMTGLAEASWSPEELTSTPQGKLNWQSLAYRLGTDEQGFLAYLSRITQMKYRGYPEGISLELES